MDSNEPLPVIPRLPDLVVDPFAPSRGATDEDQGARLPIELGSDPPLYRGVTATRNRLPIVVRYGRIALDSPHIPDLSGTPAVWLVMKTVERLASHDSLREKALGLQTRAAG